MQLLILAILLILIPVCTGMLPAARVKGYENNVPLMWSSGMVIQWAVFQVICVSFIVAGPGETFPAVFRWYGIAAAVLALAGASLGRLYVRKHGRTAPEEVCAPDKRKKAAVGWAVFGTLLALQLFMAVFWAYADGDDAYYVSTSVVTEKSNTMYQILPYTGFATELDVRHGLAPFPVWIAVLARASGMHAAAVSHVILPVALISMAYVIYGMIGKEVCRGRRELLPVYMIFVSLLILWGNYSLYTPETFLMTRMRQGKAVLGSIVLPMAFWVFFRVGEQLQKKIKAQPVYWGLLFCIVTAACLCSTMGAFLMIALMGIWGICQIWCNRCFRIIPPLAICAMPALAYLGIYFWMR